MATGGRLVGAFLVMAASFAIVLPAAAQEPDPFRSAAPPVAAPAPASRPRPPPAPEIEPAFVAPPPAPAPPVAAPPVPSLPTASQLWARVRQVAQAEGIAVPLSGNPPVDETGTAAQYRALLGSWGPGTWQGVPGGDKLLLVIQSVDAEGRLRGVAGVSGGTTGPAFWFSLNSPVSENRFVVQVVHDISLSNHPTGQRYSEEWSLELRTGGTLFGTRYDNKSTVTLSQLQ